MDDAAKTLTARQYLRVSRDSSGEGRSVDEQYEENTAAIDRRGWQAHPVPYRDDKRSASRYARRGREDFEKLVSDLAARRFGADILVIWESSREI